MKLIRLQRSGTCWVEVMLATTGLLAGQLSMLASVQEEKLTASSEVASTPATPAMATATPDPQNTKPEAQVSSAAAFSPTIQEMLKLADAKVSADVMKSFVEHSALASPPGAAEIVALKERGVADEVITALIARATQARPQTAPARVQIAIPAIVRDFSTGGHLDPESYDFWYYHYAYPRALSYSYRTLLPSPPFYSGGHHLYHRHGSHFDRYHY